MSDIKSDATEMSAPDLLMAAARLVNRALQKLDLSETPCPHCDKALFYNLEHARVNEQLQDTPKRLLGAADRLKSAIVDGKPLRQSNGYDAAVERKAALVSGPDPRD